MSAPSGRGILSAIVVIALLLPAAAPIAAAWHPEPANEREEFLEWCGEPCEEIEESCGDACEAGEGLTLAAGLPGASEPGGSSPSIGGSAMTFFHYPSPRQFSFASRAGETSIGANLDTGNVMFMMALNTARVHWDDTAAPPAATWEDVSFPLTATVSLDAYLYTDQTTGRTFAMQLLGPESAAAYTDDDGTTWIPMVNTGAPPSIDHEKLATGPYHAPLPANLPSPAYPNAVYYCLQPGVTNGDRNGLGTCARSDDGGLTWGEPTLMNDFQCFPIHDQPAVGPDGTVYVPHRGCGPLSSGKPLGYLFSEDNGVTWQVGTIPGTLMSTYTVTSFEFGAPTDIAFDAGGRMYFTGASGVFSGGVQTAKVPIVATRDAGSSTWNAPVNIGASLGIQNAEMTSIVAGDDGRAAAMFYGTTTGGNDQAAGFAGVWHLYVSYTFDGGATWETIDTTPNDPVQVGCIWNRGGSNACRNLLDFEDITVDGEGRVVVGYADGCISSACVAGGGPSTSRDSYGKIARQTTGKRLFAAFDPPGGIDPLQVDAGGVYKTVVGSPVTLQGIAYGGVPSYTYAWDYDLDGTTDATGASPSYPASTFGAYTVRLTVTDTAGTVASDTAQILVREPAGETLARSYSFDNTSDCSDAEGWTVSVGTEVRLVGLSAGGTQWHLTDDPAAASPPCAWYNGDDALQQYVESSGTNLNSPGGAGCFYLPPNAQGARLAFNLAGASESGFDFFRVQARLGCDAGTFETVGAVLSGFVSPLGSYVAMDRSLTDFIGFGGGPAQVRFRFLADESVDDTGFQLDDIQLLVKDGPPVLAAIADQVTDDLSTLSFTVSAVDPDLDPLTYSSDSLPAGATLDAATGAFSWSPGFDQAPGSYDVTFHATDGLFTDSMTVHIDVLNVAPTAAGSASALTTDRLTAVQFTDASFDPDGTVVAWSWDFGDSTGSSEQNPAHTYPALGTYAVNLQVTDNDGDIGSAVVASVTVVNLAPAAAFSRAPGGDANRVDPIQFTDASSDRDGSIVTWSWNFDDAGATSSEASPSYTFTTLGPHTVTLTVTDNEGASASASEVVNVVNLAPAVDFSVDPSSPHVLQPVFFTDASVDRDGTVVAWHWDFGNGLTADTQDAITTYVQGGFYTVTLSVTDNEGASAQASRVIAVCDPGLQAGSIVGLDHLHLELGGCIDVNLGDLISEVLGLVP